MFYFRLRVMHYTFPTKKEVFFKLFFFLFFFLFLLGHTHDGHEFPCSATLKEDN